MALVSTEADADLSQQPLLPTQTTFTGGLDDEADDYDYLHLSRWSQPTASSFAGPTRSTVAHTNAPPVSSRLLVNEPGAAPGAHAKRTTPYGQDARSSVVKRPRLVEDEVDQQTLPRDTSIAAGPPFGVNFVDWQSRSPESYGQPRYRPPSPVLSNGWSLERPPSQVTGHGLVRVSSAGYAGSLTGRSEGAMHPTD